MLKKGYSLEDEHLWPLELITVIDGVLLKLQANCLEGNEFTLSVNEIEF